jgi:hypothetical protein
MLRGLTFLAICISGGFTLNALSKPRPPDLPVAASPAVPTSAWPVTWLHDMPTAQALAKAEGKDILLEFDGPESSRGTPPMPGSSSPRILDSRFFLRPIETAFVPLRVSLSSDAPPEQLARISAWATRLAVTRFPTFILLDSNGTPYARTELVTKSAWLYFHEFRRLRKVRIQRDRELALADAAKGIDRARHLDAVLKAVGPLADTEYAALEQRVTELNPRNTAGLRAKYEATVAHRKIDRTVQDEVYPLVDRGEYGAAIARLDRLIADTKPSRSQRQLLVAFKGQLYFGLRDRLTSTRLLDEAIALDPNSESGRRARAAKHQFADVPVTKPGATSGSASR